MAEDKRKQPMGFADCPLLGEWHGAREKQIKRVWLLGVAIGDLGNGKP